MRDTVEIRIHGVGGGSASDLLDDPHPRRIAGDTISGFYEPSRPHPELDEGDRLARRRRAFAWGGNTSGSWRTALWVLLLPFALLNVGGWMHAPDRRPSRVLRVFGLTVTLSAVLLTAVAVYDVLAIQCGGSAACVEGVAWLSPFGWEAGGSPVFAEAPTRRLALVTVVPGLLLALLWFAGRYGYNELERFRNDELESPDGDGLRLDHPAFWNGYEPAFRTRMVHLAAGRGVVALALAWSVASLTSGVGAIVAVAIAAFSAGVVVFAGVAITWRVLYARRPEPALKRTLAGLRTASWLALALAVGQASIATGGRPSLGAPRTFFAGLFTAPYEILLTLAALQAGLLLVLWLARRTRVRRRPDAGRPDCEEPWGRPGRVAFDGRGQAVTATLALFLVVAIGAGAHRTTASAVGVPLARWDPVQEMAVEISVDDAAVTAQVEDCPECEQRTVIGSPWWYETTAHVVVALLVLLGLQAWRALRTIRDAPDDERRDQVAAHLHLNPVNENDVDLTNPTGLERCDRILRNWAVVCEIVRADDRLLQTVRVAGVLAVVLLFVQVPQATPGMGWRPDWMGRSLGPLATVALWLVGLLPLLAVATLRLAAVNDRLRRQIGAVWDVLIFWPRHIHPFAPPCYAERVIPQLQWHLDHILLEEEACVVLAGHSQGSVIAAAATAVRNTGVAARTRSQFDLVVYGSPIAALYERVFPAYFGQDFYATVDHATRRWHHLFSRTDIFAYPFWDELWRADPSTGCRACGHAPGRPYDAPAPPIDQLRHVDYVVIDPELWDWPSHEPPPPKIRGHSTYGTNEHVEFEEHLRRIAAEQQLEAAQPV